MLRPTARPLVLLVLVLAVGGCSGSDEDDLSADDFREGDCRTLAPAVLDIGRTVGDLDDEAPLPEELMTLTAAQDVLRNTPLVSPELTPAVQQLVVDVGFVRFRSAGNTYGPELAEAVTRSYDALVAACTDTGG